MLDPTIAGLLAEIAGITPQLALVALLNLLVGLILWYVKKFTDDRKERLNTINHLNRIITGGEEGRTNGALDVLEIHDSELSEGEQHRENIERRMRITERRVDRLAEEAGVRNGLKEISDNLREEADGKWDAEGTVDDGPWDVSPGEEAD